MLKSRQNEGKKARAEITQSQARRADALLLLTAGIWGFAFVAQRVGMDYIGPFAFNGIRFALGGLALVPLMVWSSRKKQKKPTTELNKSPQPENKKLLIFGGILAGTLVFFGASFQQVGLIYTTAGNAGFITGLYVVIVPIMGLAIGQRTTMGTAFGAILAAAGLYMLSFTDSLVISWGDLLVLIGAFFWAAQVLVIGWLSPQTDTIKLAFAEFMVCSGISMAVAFAIETTTWQAVSDAALPLLYGGLASVGVAYTIQILIQKKTHPAHAAIIMSLEAVFAVLGGWLFLGEVLSIKGIMGCCLMLAGMVLSQLWGLKTIKHTRNPPEKIISPN